MIIISHFYLRNRILLSHPSLSDRSKFRIHSDSLVRALIPTGQGEHKRKLIGVIKNILVEIYNTAIVKEDVLYEWAIRERTTLKYFPTAF